MEQYAERYTIVGMPSADPASDIAEFIETGNVGNITHIVGTDSLWAEYGAFGTPAWMTISASGETNTGSGPFTRTLLNGEDWIDGL